MKQDNPKSPLIIDENVTISLEVPAPDSSETKSQSAKSSRELYQLAEGEILAGRYLIGDILGFGGFGITYSAWDSKLDTKVAIKEYYPSNLVNRVPGRKEVEIYSKKQEAEFEKGLNRFLGEAQNMAKFSGEKNIVNVYNYFKENGTAYLVMEFLDGVSLKEYIRIYGEKLPYEQVVRFTKCVISALKVLHKKHVIHRDISPDNIFICKDGSVKLIDFGAARFALETEQEKTLSIVLKPGFAPPEQYRSKGKQGPWTDIYALGATMYRAVTGVVPEESVNRTVSDELKEPKEYVPDIPEYFNKILMKCLAIQPELRFQTVEDLEKKLDGRKKVSSVKGELIRRKAKRGIFITAALLLIAGFGWKEYEYIKALQNKANLVESTVTLWLPIEENQDEKEIKEAFDLQIADFKATYPAVTVQVECIPEEEYADKLANAFAEGQAPTVFESSYLPATHMEFLEDLSDTYEMLNMKNYRFGNFIEEIYHKKQLPTGFSIPIIYENTLLSQAESGPVTEKKNDKEAFLAGTVPYYTGTYQDYREIQDKLAGLYQMKPPDGDTWNMQFLNIWGVSSTGSQDEISAGVRLLYYLMSEQAQDVWYVQHENGFPLYKNVLQTYIMVNPEMKFLENLEIKKEQVGNDCEDEISDLHQR
ncbi:MAG: serine/threonine-protein kinase [Roseburia sp.]|nr:serine/threonine-protein kinase [Roseburia sp.]MCM1278561.1 serine/threonine-protein kinase [Robinsoniella sp.]